MAPAKTRSRFTRIEILLTGLLLAVAFTTITASFYIEFRYPAVMPRSPQPENGRVYPMKFKGHGTVYVDKKELDRSDFVEYRLMPLFGVSMMLYFGIGTRLGWWSAGPRNLLAKL